MEEDIIYIKRAMGEYILWYRGIKYPLHRYLPCALEEKHKAIPFKTYSDAKKSLRQFLVEYKRRNLI